MEKCRARGRHKWKWHKKTERAVFSLVAIANTKAWGEALIEATEWHAQSNWISSAVSSNLIWPALWRMTGERNTFPWPPLPLGVPHTQSDPQTCCFHTTTGQHRLCGLLPLTPSLLLSTPPGQPLLHCLHTLCVPPLLPQTTLAFSAFLTPQPPSTGTSRYSKVMWGGVRWVAEVTKMDKKGFPLSESKPNRHNGVTARLQQAHSIDSLNMCLFPKALFWIPVRLKDTSLHWVTLDPLWVWAILIQYTVCCTAAINSHVYVPRVLIRRWK